MRISTLSTSRLRIFAKLVIAAASFEFAATAPVQADVVFANEITNSNPSTANPFTSGQTFDPNITVSGIGRGSGIGLNTGSNRYNARSWSFPSFDAGDYFTFTLTPNPGYEIDFTSLTGEWRRSNTGPTTYALRSSLDGFSTDIASGAILGSSSDVAYDLNLASL